MFRKKDFFFSTLENISENVLRSAERFASGIHERDDLPAFAAEMKALETVGDQYTRAVYTALNKTFITPIEREDILALASSLDDVVDGLEACASRFDMYEVQDYDEYVVLFADNLLKSAKEIHQAIHLLSMKKLLPMLKHTIQINVLENEADALLRKSIKDLFKQVKDPVELIKRKEIYEMLELASDFCEDVANKLDTIIMRNS